MKIPKVHLLKNKYVSPKTLENIQNLAKRMNSQTVSQPGEFSGSSNILSRLNSKQGVFIDARYLYAPSEEIGKGSALIELKSLYKGVFAEFDVDIQTGQIIQGAKPFFMSWKKVLGQTERFLNSLQSNFENSKIVEKRFLSFPLLSPKGVEKLDEARKIVS